MNSARALRVLLQNIAMSMLSQLSTHIVLMDMFDKDVAETWQ